MSKTARRVGVREMEVARRTSSREWVDSKVWRAEWWRRVLRGAGEEKVIARTCGASWESRKRWECWIGVVVFVIDFIVSRKAETVEIDRWALEAGVALGCRRRWKRVAVISCWVVEVLIVKIYWLRGAGVETSRN